MSDRSTAEGHLPCRGSARWPILLAAGALACLVAAVFFPILGFEFVDIDVGQQVVDNPYIRGLSGENLKHIFTSPCVYSYYPIRSLSFAVDYQIWGLNPTGFKLTNGLVHLANVLLVFWLMERLFRHPVLSDGSPNTWREVSLAAFSAAIFAVHPVVVEPVAWVAGREELLMTLAAVIPLLIVAWDVLTLSRPRFRKILGGTSALWGISAAAIVIKKLAATNEAIAAEPGLFSTEWVALVLNT